MALCETSQYVKYVVALRGTDDGHICRDTHGSLREGTIFMALSEVIKLMALSQRGHNIHGSLSERSQYSWLSKRGYNIHAL